MSETHLEALRSLLGADAVSDGREPLPDPRLARHPSGLALGTPLARVRVRDHDSLVELARWANQRALRLCAMGEASVFWDAMRVADRVIVDLRALAGPLCVDAEARRVVVGAGRRIEEVDRAARKEGLCLLAYPDSDGHSSVGALLAVASTTGLGNGRTRPLDQVLGARVVDHHGATVGYGDLGGMEPAPKVGGIEAVAGSQGQLGIITELSLRLAVAPRLVDARAELPDTIRLDADRLDSLRQAIGRPGVDSLRLDRVDDGRKASGYLLVRTWDETSSDVATDEARALACVMGVGSESLRLQVESEAARRGEEGEHAWRYDLAAFQHQARIRHGGFWGVEVFVPWGPGAEACARLLESLYDELDANWLVERRIGVYPYPAGVSIGVQIGCHRQAVPQVVERLKSVLPDLLAAGGQPYRPGALWREALSDFDGPLDPECGGAPWLSAFLTQFEEGLPVRESASPLARRLSLAWPEATWERVQRGVWQARFADLQVEIDTRPGTARAVFGSWQSGPLAYRVRGELDEGARAWLGAGLRRVAQVCSWPELRDPDHFVSAIDAGAEGVVWNPAIGENDELWGAALDHYCRRRADGHRVPEGLGFPTRYDLRERPSSGSPRREQSSLESYLRIVEHTFDASAIGAVRAELAVFEAERADTPGPYFPLECSLKFADGQLRPRIRLVDYGQDFPRASPHRALHLGRRRRRLLGTLDARQAGAWHPWLEQMEAHLRGPAELARGVDMDLRTGERRDQLYLFCEGGDAQRAMLQSSLEYFSSDAARGRELLAWLEGAAGFVRLALMAFAVDARGQPSAKLYFDCPREHAAQALGLVEAGQRLDFGLPERGLAVLELNGTGASWAKWDFRCPRHARGAAEIYRSLASVVGASSAVAPLLDPRMVAWPTWLSRGRGEATVYFVPR